MHPRCSLERVNKIVSKFSLVYTNNKCWHFIKKKFILITYEDAVIKKTCFYTENIFLTMFPNFIEMRLKV